MTNNDILRRLRYTFEFSDDQMIGLFASAPDEVNRAIISDWLKKEEDPDFKEIDDMHLAIFLNGLIDEKRGKKEGAPAPVEKTLTNNVILRKLKIAMNFRDEDILDVLAKADMKISKHELSALFRNTNHAHYRLCNDQFLRSFLQGLQKIYRVS
ncbi:MAG: DUF1456 family protein [Bacteroidetes bacterium]|nr:DUF1456 family protein [Bacteroidota bacterium]